MAPSPSPIYPVTLGVKSDGTLMASGDGKTEAVRDSLNLHGITMTLRIEAGVSTQEPDWSKLVSKLGSLTPFYTLSLVQPAAVGPAPNFTLTSPSTPVPLAGALQAGASLVITLRKSQAEETSQTPAWSEVVAELGRLTGPISYGTDMTCVGP